MKLKGVPVVAAGSGCCCLSNRVVAALELYAVSSKAYDVLVLDNGPVPRLPEKFIEY
jgi:hypothetical protein